MTRVLQDKYRDYNRRKTAPFRQLVEHAYRIVMHSYGLGSNSNSDQDLSDGSIECLDEENENGTATAPNLLGDVMNSLYSTNRPPLSMPAPPAAAAAATQGAKNSDPGPIDISSDEADPDEAELLPPPKSVLPSELLPAAKDIPNGTAVSSAAGGTKRLNNTTEVPVQQTSKKRKINPVSAPPLALVKPPKAKPTSKKEFATKTSSLTFGDVGGVDKILKELCELLLHLKHPELYEHIGLTAPRGFLLHGPPGSGKTLLANAIAGQLKVPLIEVAATELVAGISGESEERIREVFEKAATVAPCVLFIDEVDVISANRNNAQKDLERRIVSQLLSSLDGLTQVPNGNQVVVIGATNRADTLDPALRRVGRFDQEICLGIPDRLAREQILKIVCKKLRLEEPFNFDDLAVLTPGYVGADLLALAMRAATIAVKRAFSFKDLQRKPQEDENVEERGEPNENGNKVDLVVADSTDEAQQMDVDPVAVNETTRGATETAIPPINEVIGDAKAPVTENKNPEDEAMAVHEHTTGQPMEEGALQEQKTLEEKFEQSKLSEEENKELTVPEGTPAIGSNEQPPAKDKPASKQEHQHTLGEMLEWLNGENKNPLSEKEIEALRVTMADFKAAVAVVQPSAKREGFITVPDVTWDDIGSLRDIRDELKLAILAPVKYPKKLELLGLQSPSGVLLCGPPGCGKTLLAKAVANEAGINFISVKGPELLNMYVGESERAVRQCFQRAKNSAPCVIFFDEFDALCPKRSNRSDNSGGARVVNQLLTEMDGVEDRRGVFLMAATNRPDMIDGAVLRPGRLDKILYVGLPEVNDRGDILRALTKVSSIFTTVNFKNKSPWPSLYFIPI